MSGLCVLFTKYHALGNDYLFLDSTKFEQPSITAVRKICHRNFGIGSDGILYGGQNPSGEFFLKVINPDGSEAEISGNGVRIFAYAMLESGNVDIDHDFTVNTSQKSVSCKILSSKNISVDMGIASFHASNIPSFREKYSELEINGKKYVYYPVSIGNPHCVIFVDKLSADDAKLYGPIFESNPLFLEKTNVQFAKLIDKNNINLEIWERGAGYTLASGSSACAVFAVAKKLHLCDDQVCIHMPGGNLQVQCTENFHIIQTGPVEKIADCNVAVEFLK